MKNSPLTTTLLVLLAISAIWSVISCLQYNRCARQLTRNTAELRLLQGQYTGITGRQQTFQMLANDTAVYSKTHPELEPILESIGIRKTASTGATTNK